MSNIRNYSKTPASNNSTPPNGWPEGTMFLSQVNDTARQQMADHRTQWEDAQWFDWGDTPTYVSGTSFTVATDLTARYLVNRRIKATGTTPFTIYGTISSSSYGAPNTTVVVTWDSGSLDATLSNLFLSNLTPTTDSLPRAIFALLSGATFTGALGVSGAAVNESQGADIPSAATINLDTATGNLVDVTGVTPITAITLSQGRQRIVRFTGALTLTNGASLVLPGAANITTAAGDYAIFAGYAAGVVRCVSYVKAVFAPSTGKQPTTQIFTSGTATYTTPAGVTRIKVRMVGGGGGGGGAPTGSGTAGNNTTFSTFAANGGGSGTGAGQGGGGGTATGGTVNIPGGGGGGATDSGTSGVAAGGAVGGSSAFGGGGAGGTIGVTVGTGFAGATNSGGGGGGAGAANAQNSGSGGGSGGYVEGYITSPAATYSYSVAGTAAGGTGAANAGGAGAAGIIIVEEFYA